MLIRELEQKSGLDRATIRFYEREGFIDPERKENGYREYTQEDLDHLKKIRLLRQLGMSLETIKGLQKGTENFSTALSAQIQTLEQQIQTASDAKAVCTAIFQANTSYAALDAEYYLPQLHKSKQPQSLNRENAAAQYVFREPVYRHYHPVRRFLARITDYMLIRIILTFFLTVVFRIRPLSTILSEVLTFAIPFLMVRIGAAMLHCWGTTPGKWLYGLAVRTENGDKLSYEDALEREKLVLKEGYGYGIPVWSIYRMYKSYMYYGDVELDWDRESEYQYHSWSARRIVTLAAAIILLTGMSLWSVLDITQPKHRGELSIAQFAENYNYYMKMLNEDADRTALLQSDGTHYAPPADTVVVYIEGVPGSEDMDFRYTTSDGNIRSIHYESNWTDVGIVSPKSKACQIAAITLLMSQKGIGQSELLEFGELLDSADYSVDGKLSYENIEITWSVTTENCEVISNWITTADDAKPSYASMVYDIMIRSE